MEDKFFYLHQVETCSVALDSPISTVELRKLLLSHGFQDSDGYFYFNRPDSAEAPVWQTDVIVSANLFFEGRMIYIPEEDSFENEEIDETFADKILLHYLLASLPRHFIDQFVKIVFRLKKELKAKLQFKEFEDVPKDKLIEQLNLFADELTCNLGEPGEEFVQIFIHQYAPRKGRPVSLF